MKKVLTSLVIVVMVLGLCACGNSKEKMQLNAMELDWQQVRQEYDDNPISAKKLYDEKIVKWTAKVWEIDENGFVETVAPGFLINVFFKDDNDVVTLRKDDEITVVGKLKLDGHSGTTITSIIDAYLISGE